MSRALEWYKRQHWLVKAALFVPVVVVLVLLFVLRRTPDPANVKIGDATDAVDSVASAADQAIKTIEKENEAINDRASARGDAVGDAAGEGFGQFDSAADLYTKPRR